MNQYLVYDSLADANTWIAMVNEAYSLPNTNATTYSVAYIYNGQAAVEITPTLAPYLTPTQTAALQSYDTLYALGWFHVTLPRPDPP